jgi:hypothetical protein
MVYNAALCNIRLSPITNFPRHSHCSPLQSKLPKSITQTFKHTLRKQWISLVGCKDIRFVRIVLVLIPVTWHAFDFADETRSRGFQRRDQRAISNYCFAIIRAATVSTFVGTDVGVCFPVFDFLVLQDLVSNNIL